MDTGLRKFGAILEKVCKSGAMRSVIPAQSWVSIAMFGPMSPSVGLTQTIVRYESDFMSRPRLHGTDGIRGKVATFR